MHFALFTGYVKNSNLLKDQLEEIRHAGKASAANLVYSELIRHLSFECNGTVLHEWYFDNMTRDADGRANNIAATSDLGRRLGEKWGDIETWRRTSARSAPCAEWVGL